MTVNRLYEKLQQCIAEGDGDLEVACDYPLGDIRKGRDTYEPGDWSTVETVSKRRMEVGPGEGSIGDQEAGGKLLIFLDWRV